MGKDITDGVSQSDNVNYSEYELKNGLKVILSADSSIPSVVINLCYHVGSKDEENNKKGFAHLFEHLMFEGSLNIPCGEYDNLCLNAGGDNNAYTTEDKTNYYIILPSNQLELGLWMESDRMLQFAISQESLDTQKGVVTEEKKQTFDNRPYGSLSLEFPPRLFPNSVYGWDTIGEIDDINKATMEDIKSFFEKYYIPNNAVLTIAGDLDEKETIELINKYFGSIPRGKNSIERKLPVKDSFKSSRDFITDNIQLPGIFVGYRIPKEYTKESFALELLSDILSHGDSSIMYKELVYDKQLCSEVGAYVDCKEFAGVFYLYALLMPGVDVESVEKVVYRIIDDVTEGKLPEQDLQKAKNKFETKHALRKQSILSKADMLTHYKTLFNNAELINSNIDNYLSITKDDIASISKEFLNENNRVTLIYIPKTR
ncbi:MAG: insulinase family protein [Ignavibacteriae bacterium]|nr:MAG: insulinase family protein [Ignavibacteriota bacterium]